MFTVRAPDDEHLSHFVARQRLAPLTYPEVGATLGQLPPGYTHVRTSIVVGNGHDVFTRAKDGLACWQPATAAGIGVFPAGAPLEVGTTVALVLRVGPLHALAACRVVVVIDEPRRYGFAYGTLPAHPEEGEELFLVTHADDGTVRFEITAFSRPHDLVTRLGAPVARAVQRRTVQKYLEGLRSYAQR
jgi:uncharacterized protein (UPF0548 family)